MAKRAPRRPIIAKSEGTTDYEEPTRALDDDALFLRLRGWFDTDKDHYEAWREEAREDYDFVAAQQWSDDDKRVLKAQNRPASVFNQVGAMISSVLGFEVSNRQEVRYIPRELGDSSVNETLTHAAKWFRDQSDAEDEESDAFGDAAICGYGWTETRLDHTENPDGEPLIDRVDPLEMIPDSAARKRNLSDARRVWRVRRMSCAEARELFPDADKSDLHASWADSWDGKAHSKEYPDRYENENERDLKDEDEVVIVECQWWEREPFVRFIDPMTGQESSVSPGEFKSLQGRLTQLGVQDVRGVPQTRKVYRRAFLGKQVLESNETPKQGHFTYKAITGKRDRNKGYFYGLVRDMKDPQRWTNKLFSQMISQISKNTKGGIIAERGAFENDREAAEDWAKDDSIVWANPGAVTQSRITPKPQTAIPTNMPQLLEFSSGMMPRVTGINLEFLGMREANQAGVLEYQRRQAGVTILAGLFDSLRRYRKEQGRLMLLYIQEDLSDERMVRILGEEGAKYVPLTRDMTAGDYDVIVDDAPSSPNQKEKNWEIITMMAPYLKPALEKRPELVGDLLRYSPLPDDVTGKIGKALTEPPPGAQEQEMAMKAKAVAEIDKIASEGEKNRATALKTQAETASVVAGMMLPPTLNPDLPPAPIPSGPVPGLPVPPGAMTPPPMQGPPPGGPSASGGLLGPMMQQAPQMPAPPQGGPAGGPIAEVLMQLTGQLQQIAQQVTGMQQAMQAPKQLIFDESGQAVGVQNGFGVQQIARGPSGAIVGTDTLQ